MAKSAELDALIRKKLGGLGHEFSIANPSS
jgi:hypothetical protein